LTIFNYTCESLEDDLYQKCTSTLDSTIGSMKGYADYKFFAPKSRKHYMCSWQIIVSQIIFIIVIFFYLFVYHNFTSVNKNCNNLMLSIESKHIRRTSNLLSVDCLRPVMREMNGNEGKWDCDDWLYLGF